jgi:hypothetical protein
MLDDSYDVLGLLDVVIIFINDFQNKRLTIQGVKEYYICIIISFYLTSGTHGLMFKVILE